MRPQLTKSLAMASLITLSSATAALWTPTPQDEPRLNRVALYNCEVEVKELDPDESKFLRTQVYYSDWQNDSGTEKGTEFFLHVPGNGLLILGDSQAEAPSPEGDLIELEWDTKYFVRVFWDNDDGDKQAYIQVVTFKDGVETVLARKESLYSGSFDAVKELGEATVETVRSDDASGKERIRITAHNYGLSIGFTLTDA